MLKQGFNIIRNDDNTIDVVQRLSGMTFNYSSSLSGIEYGTSVIGNYETLAFVVSPMKVNII